LGGQKDVHGIGSEPFFFALFASRMPLKNHFFFMEELSEGAFMQEEMAHLHLSLLYSTKDKLVIHLM
jgi:hypothetical protein